MTDIRSRAVRRLLAGALVLGLAIGADGPAAAQLTDPATAPGLFTTPVYPGANTARQGGSLSAGSPNGSSSSGADGTRTIRNGSGANAGNGDARQAAPGDRDPNAPQLRYAAPPKPSEFQRFVESATGRLLPVFGSNFFDDPTNNAVNALDNVPVSADYVVGPGDEIVIRAWGAIDVDYRATVDRNGLLNLPKVGSFSVAGTKAADLERQLRSQIGRLYTNFDLSASLGQLRGLRVFVVGPAQRPGVLTLASQSTLLSAIVAAGGPATNGSMRRVQLRRDGKVVSELDIYGFLVGGDKSKDLQLAAGDVVVFLPVGPRVALTGALDTPAIYELKSAQEPAADVLAYAGGRPTLANPNLAQLERVDTSQPKAARFVEEFKLDTAGLAKPLRDGDVLTLLPISPQFANAVTLRGHVAQPLRYPWKPGMRVRDLIPDREALITPDFYRRKNLLVQLIDDDADLRDVGTGAGTLDRNGLGVGSRDARNTDAGGNGNGGANVDRYGNRASAGSSNVYNNSNNAGNANGAGYGAQNSDYGGNAGTGNAAIDPATGLRYEPYVDPRTSLTRAERLRRERDRALVNGARRSPQPLFDELNWDYAVIERLDRTTLTTRVIPFNLGKAVLQNDESANVELLAGDVVTIYGQRDIRVPVSRQTRLVSIEGEVGAPGVYQLSGGDTLQSVIARAGGFTPQAYVYGLEFTREETRQRQRENLVQAIARLETLASVQSARDVANRRDDAAGAASSLAVSNAATQAQLSRLRNTQPNGRIALELTPDVNSLASLPTVPLEGGDRVVVPPRPGFVTVAGAVVNSNAFLWKPGRTAGEYLRLAGADEAAEPGNMFILRADGTVRHANDTRGFFGGSKLENEPMQPGDALIVPNQLDFETWGRAFVRNLKDFAQIFTGSGIGIAAINSL